MRYSKLGYTLALSIFLALLVPVSATPALAAGEYIGIHPREGEIGDKIEIRGVGFNPSEIVCIYLSSNAAEEGDEIDDKVTAYKQVAIANTDAGGAFTRTYTFYVPDELSGGAVIEDVHGGNYYVYATYCRSKSIVVVARFIVIGGEIELDPGEGAVGTEVQISGEGLRPDQEIAVTYDDYDVDIASGDSKTDGDGSFTCTIIIPESTAGSHIITVIDESGNRPEAEFSVEPEITIEPTEQAAGEAVNISGTGFGKRQTITITLDGNKLSTTLTSINTNHYGSFDGSFLVPFSGSHGTREVEASDGSRNKAEAQLTVLGGISLIPTTSPTSPGHVGMELFILGAGFIAEATVTITYSNNDETIPVATVPADDGGFQVNFTVPPSVAGSHEITATDSTSIATATFTMESQAPPMPVPLTPETASTAAARTHFDWGDVTDDDSGVSYTLQVASDADFTSIVLEKEGLSQSEYTAANDERLESTEKEVPYYWRVKAVDGAFNESEWTYPILFYVGFSLASMPDWVWYIFYGLGALLLGILGSWVWRRRAK